MTRKFSEVGGGGLDETAVDPGEKWEVKRRQVLRNDRRFPGRGRERQRRRLLGGGVPSLALPPLGQRAPTAKR